MTIQTSPPAKKRINSKKKGNNFESSIVKILGDKLAPLKFKRSQSSGAVLGGVNEKFLENYSSDTKVLFVGDVVPTNESDVAKAEGWKFKFALECKFYKTADNIDHLLSNTKIRRWFEQAQTDADKISKQPLLIFKFNHSDTFVGVNADTISFLPGDLSKLMTLDYRNPDGDLPPRKITIFSFKEALTDIDWWKVKV